MLYRLQCVINHPETYVEVKGVREVVASMRAHGSSSGPPLRGIAQPGVNVRNAQSVDYLKVLGGLFAFSPRAMMSLGPQMIEELVTSPISIKVGSTTLDFVAGLPVRNVEVVDEETSVFMKLGGVDILDRPSFRRPDTDDFLIGVDAKFDIVVVSHLFVETSKLHGLRIAFERVL